MVVFGKGWRKPPLGALLKPGHPLANQIVACFGLNEGYGTLVNNLLTPNQNGVWNGASPMDWRASRWGLNPYFPNGANDYFNCGKNPTTADLTRSTATTGVTWCALIKAESGARGIVERNDNNTVDAGWFVGLDSGSPASIRLYCERSIGNYNASSGGLISFGEWYAIVVTFDNLYTTGSTKFYIDGANTATTSETAGSGTPGTDIANDLRIGHANFTFPGSFKGEIGAVMIYKRIFGPADVEHWCAEPFDMLQGVDQKRHFFSSSLSINGSTGIVSGEAFGSTGAAVAGPVTGGSGIVSGEAFGTTDGEVRNNALVGVTGIASGEAFGADGLVIGPLVGSSGITSGEAFGVTGGIVAGPITGTAGITSGEAFGAGAVSFPLVGSVGITSGEAFGAGAVVSGGSIGGVFGIVSGETFGTSGVVFNVTISGGSLTGGDRFIIYIDGVEQSAYVLESSIEVDQQMRSRANGQFTTVDENGTYYPSRGDEVVIYQILANSSLLRIFGGRVFETKRTKHGGTSALITFVSCIDYNEMCDRRVVPFSTPAGTVRETLQTLFDSIMDEEGTTISLGADSGLDLTFPATEWNAIQLSEALNRIGEFSNLNWRIDFYNVFRMAVNPTSPTAAPIALAEGAANYRNLSVTQTMAKYRNRQGVRSNRKFTGLVEDTYTAMAGQDAFPDGQNLPLISPRSPKNQPLNIPTQGGTPRVFVDGVEEFCISSADLIASGGTRPTISDLAGFPARWWEFMTSSVLQYTFAMIRRPSVFATMTGGEIVILKYPLQDGQGNAQGTASVRFVEDLVEIAARAAIQGGSGKWEVVDDIRDLTKEEEIIDYAQSILDRRGDPPEFIEFETEEQALQLGQNIGVSTLIPLINQTYVIESLNSREDKKQCMHHRVRAALGSNIGRDAASFYGKLLAERSRLATDRQIEICTFLLAEDVNGLTNPGLVTGTNVTNKYIVKQSGILLDIFVFAEAADAVQDIIFQVNLNGTSVTTTAKRPRWKLGDTATRSHRDFTSNPFYVTKGDLFSIDVIQTGGGATATSLGKKISVVAMLGT